MAKIIRWRLAEVLYCILLILVGLVSIGIIAGLAYMTWFVTTQNLTDPLP